MNLSKQIKLRKVKAATATGTDAIEGDVVDMSGYDGVAFFTTIATANAGNYLKAQQGAAATLSDGVDLAAQKVVADGNGAVVLLDVYRPTKRYVRPVVIRGAASVVGEICAVQYKGRKMPEVNTVANTIVSALLISPDELAIT